MKRIIMIILVLLFTVTLSACSEDYTNISNDELVTMLESDINYYYIDVRTLSEFYESRIPGFENIDFYAFENDSSILDNLDTTRPVIIMCNSGNRSVSASKIFLEIGFTEVYNLKNGIEGWDGTTIN